MDIFPFFIVKVKALIVDVVNYLESGEHSLDNIQSKSIMYFPL